MPKKRTDGNTAEDQIADMAAIAASMTTSFNGCLAGLARYSNEFFVPFLIAASYFHRVERKRLGEEDITDSIDAYLGLLQTNIDLICRGLSGTSTVMTAYAQQEMDSFIEAMGESCLEFRYKKLSRHLRRQADLVEMVTCKYPGAIEAIEPEYGFHFEREGHPLVDETDRFLLYRIAPSSRQIKLRPDAKPVLIIPPYVLGANILAFLPGEERSYAHCFANQGFPTYIRVLKPIDVTPALQVMTGENDAEDTRRFCELISKQHGKQVTLNGYCQGGYSSLCNLLSGKLDSLVDAFITCVSPIDGTRSRDLARFLNNLPPRFNNLLYGTKTLPNGNLVADGKLMGWVYKLKSIEQEIPFAAFLRDLNMFAGQKNGGRKISKTALALNYWLQNERYDLPLAITRMSFASYNVPIARDGTLPVRLFGNPLNLKRLKDKKIPWLICYGARDDLVEKETALAALDHIEAEVTPFPKGHVAIATSWSSPKSACALHTRFGNDACRGPVRFHMDLDLDLDKGRGASSKMSVSRGQKTAAIRKKDRVHT